MSGKTRAISLKFTDCNGFKKLTTINPISIYWQLSKERGSVTLPFFPLGTPLFLVDWLIMTLNDSYYKEIKNTRFVCDLMIRI